MDQPSFLEFKNQEKGHTKGAILLLHGFPGYQARNDDIAQSLSQQTQSDSYLLLYPGLSGEGENFLFTNVLEESKKLLKHLNEQYDQIILLGHSFGGFIALRLLNQNPELFEKLILLNPMTAVPPLEATKEILNTFLEAEKEKGRAQKPFNQLLDDISLLKSWEVQSFHHQKTTLVVIGENDLVLDPVTMQSFFKDSQANLKLLEQNHWFDEDRKHLINLLIEFCR